MRFVVENLHPNGEWKYNTDFGSKREAKQFIKEMLYSKDRVRIVEPNLIENTPLH